MKIKFNILLLFSFLLSFNSKDILIELNEIDSWILIDKQANDKKIYEYKNDYSGNKYLQIVQPINLNNNLMFSTIKDISNYNLIISNKNLYSKLVSTDNDTLSGYQLIENSIPLIRDRQYIFKMFQVSENRIDWYILDKEHQFLDKYVNKNIRTLSLGAGSWQIDYLGDERVLIYKMFIDDEVNLPNILIQKIKIKHTVDIFNDFLEYLK